MTITRDQSRDTGMAMVLLLLLAFYKWGRSEVLVATLLTHVVNLVAPQVFRPLAVIWFGLSHVLGTIVSRVLMFVVFALLVTPIGMVRRAMGKDSLRLKAFKADEGSVLVARHHRFAAADLEKPF